MLLLLESGRFNECKLLIKYCLMKRYKKPNRIVQIVFFLLRNNWISILFGLLFIIFAFFLLTFSEKTNLETKAWYSSNWQYRRDVEVENDSGLGRSDEDVLVIVDTSSLITAGKMQSSCNDIRFVDSDDSTLLSYWIEGGCNTTTTRVWVRIPSLPTTGKTIYMYYGNPSASNAELPWTGGFIVLSTSACPTGWTRDANFDSRFPLSHESYGSKAGNSTHGHTVPSFTLTGNDAPAFMDTWGGATDYSSKTGHTHTVTISVSDASTLPPYTTMLFCKANDLNLFSGSVVMDKTGSVGNYYSALNDRFPYGSTSSGTQGGSNTHTHSIPQTTSTAASLNGNSITHPGSGPDPGALVATVTHTHIVSAATTNAASNLPPYYSLRYITLTTYGNIPSIITMGDSVPPLGWSRLTNFDSRLPYGSSNIGSTGGSASHNHTGSVTIQGVSNRVWRHEGGQGGGSYSAQQHTHQGTVSYTTSTYNSYPPYMSTLFIERKTSTSTSLQPEQKYNAAPSAPTNLKLDNNSTTPLVGVTNTTPSFSAKFNDPDAGDVGTHYQIQVNTNNSFTGTTMWDSGQISMPNLANGSQSQNITYGGSTIALNGSTYYWRIRFWDNNGAVSQYSSVFSFTMIDVPSAPLNPSVVSGNTQITLTWNIPSSDGGSSITDYIVQYSTDGNTWDTFDDGVSTSTTATVTDLTNGTQYYFRVAAVNGAGIGPYTASVTATPVNQIPIFTGQAYNTPVNPGDTVTWSATASDSDGQVKLLVCKTPGITASGTCSGNTWCSSSLVSSNPSCSYSVPNPTVNNTYNAYVYIVDNQNEPATGAIQGTNSSFVVSSVAPIVTGITLNGGSAINLVENNTKSVTITATVSSDNSCTTISSVTGYLYRSGIGYTGCDSAGESNGNNCYPEISCTVDSGSCTDSTDKTADYTCVVNVQYFADPTDTGTQYDSENWLATIKATNSGDLSTSTEITTGVEMNSLVAFSVTSTLNYGDLLVGGSNSPLDRILITTATGNVGLDQEHKGEEIGMCTDYPTCTVGTPIVLSHQKYSLTASTPYSTPTTAISLTNTSVEVELNLAKPTSTTAVSKNTWWGVFIPPGTLPGYYQGRNTITAVKGETTHW